MNVIQFLVQSLVAAGLAAPKTTAEYTKTPNFKAFSAAQTQFKKLIFDILALDLYFFFKLNDQEYRKNFISACKEIRNSFKIFLLSQSWAADRRHKDLKIEDLLLKYANCIYAAMTAYIEIENQDGLEKRAPTIHKAGYFLSQAAETMKEARQLLPDNLL